MRRTKRSCLLVTVVAALLLSTWGSGVTLAQDHEHGDDNGHEHGDDHGGGDPGDGPPYGPPELGRNPGEQRREMRYGPVDVAAPAEGEHHGHTDGILFSMQKPCTDCQITSMTARLTNPDGEEIGNAQGLQLHHIVLLQRGMAGRDDATCGSGANWQPTSSNSTPLGLLGERFFASGDERTPAVFPRGYGYPVGSGGWSMIWELANANSTPQTVYVDIVYDYVPGNTLHNLDPVWFDIDQCGDSEVDTGTGQHTHSYTWNVTRPGAVLYAWGHQHGNWVNEAVDGGTDIELRIGGEDGEVICDTRAGYDESPFYTDHHGMKWLSSMSTCGDTDNPTALGLVGQGDQMTITSNYSHQTAWPGQMGILVAYISQEVPEPPQYPWGHDIHADLDGSLSVDLVGGDEPLRVPTGGEGACNPEGTPTTMTGSFGGNHDGHASLAGIEVVPQPSDLLLTDEGTICAAVDLEVPEGELMTGNGSGTLSLQGVTAEVEITATGVFAPFIPGDCVLAVDIGTMTGTIDGTGPPSTAHLTASDATVSRASDSCGAYGTLLNVHLGLPTTDTEMGLDLTMDWL